MTFILFLSLTNGFSLYDFGSELFLGQTEIAQVLKKRGEGLFDAYFAKYVAMHRKVSDKLGFADSPDGKYLAQDR